MRLRWFEDAEDADHSWRDLYIFVRSRGVDSAYKAVTADQDALFWTPDRQLLASIVDLLSILVWQPTKDGRRGRNKPKPIKRPGVSDEAKSEKKHGGKKNAKSAARIAELLGFK